MDGFKGGCLCGQVRYEVTAPPISFFLCNCRACQYVSGGEPGSIVLVPRAAFSKSGKTKGFTICAESGNKLTRHFCIECGTPMFTELPTAPDLWVIKGGTLDDPSQLKPEYNAFIKDAQPWAHQVAGIPSYERGMGQEAPSGSPSKKECSIVMGCG